MEEPEEPLPDDIRALKLIVSDLQRRHRNAQHTIESQSVALRDAHALAEERGQQLVELRRIWDLECIKSKGLQRYYSRVTV